MAEESLIYGMKMKWPPCLADLCNNCCLYVYATCGVGWVRELMKLQRPPRRKKRRDLAFAVTTHPYFASTIAAAISGKTLQHRRRRRKGIQTNPPHRATVSRQLFNLFFTTGRNPKSAILLELMVEEQEEDDGDDETHRKNKEKYQLSTFMTSLTAALSPTVAMITAGCCPAVIFGHSLAKEKRKTKVQGPLRVVFPTE
ncbi:hypothetical protein L1049_021885 [Liquidambar formosana]|uniref:Uncharacterized protein n=1 Tax=Liquidambar formosana TaxID=63359 RepID=A0AAP0RBR9_LIQFO